MDISLQLLNIMLARVDISDTDILRYPEARVAVQQPARVDLNLFVLILLNINIMSF